MRLQDGGRFVTGYRHAILQHDKLDRHWLLEWLKIDLGGFL